MEPAPEQALVRLQNEQNIWIASVRPDGRPHLAPVWFVYYQGCIYIGTDPKSVKSGNIHVNPDVVLALEEGTHPVICEGSARVVSLPWSEGLLAAFFQKYEWDLNQEAQYNQLVEVVPRKWLSW